MTNGKISSYRDLKVWQSAIEISVACYRMTQAFPKAEVYGLTSQIRRCSVSISANVAEGWGRESRGSFVQFLKMAQGSLKELETHLIIAERVGLIGQQAVDDLLARCDENGKMLGGLIRTLQNRKFDE